MAGSLLRLSRREVQTLCDGVRTVTTAQQSMRLAGARYPAVIIASSGMATGGRVLHHLKALAPDARHSIVLAGHQAGGTRGQADIARRVSRLPATPPQP